MHYQPYPISNTNHESLIQLFQTTFTNSEGTEEGKIIAKLVQDFLNAENNKELIIFTAINPSNNNELCGAVIFSPLMNEMNIPTMLLSPMAIATQYQGKSIGQALIKYAFNELVSQGVEVIVTYGDINFYGKSGFIAIDESIIPAPKKLSYPEG